MGSALRRCDGERSHRSPGVRHRPAAANGAGQGQGKGAGGGCTPGVAVSQRNTGCGGSGREAHRCAGGSDAAVHRVIPRPRRRSRTRTPTAVQIRSGSEGSRWGRIAHRPKVTAGVEGPNHRSTTALSRPKRPEQSFAEKGGGAPCAPPPPPPQETLSCWRRRRKVFGLN